VGDACVGGLCQAGSRVTAGHLSGLVREGATAAAGACVGERRKPVRKVGRPLAQVARLLAQANDAATDRKLRKKLSQARRAARQAAQRLGRERARLSPACGARLDAAIAATSAGLSCLP
jgi:hypothetical protein